MINAVCFSIGFILFNIRNWDRVLGSIRACDLWNFRLGTDNDGFLVIPRNRLADNRIFSKEIVQRVDKLWGGASVELDKVQGRLLPATLGLKVKATPCFPLGPQGFFVGEAAFPGCFTGPHLVAVQIVPFEVVPIDLGMTRADKILVYS